MPNVNNVFPVADIRTSKGHRFLFAMDGHESSGLHLAVLMDELVGTPAFGFTDEHADEVMAGVSGAWVCGIW